MFMQFWGNLVKSYAGDPLESWRPHLGEMLDPQHKSITLLYYRTGLTFQINFLPENLYV